MKIHFKLFFTLFLSFLACLSFAEQKTIAITIDDLPFVGEYRNFHLNMIIDTLKNQEVPATGFIIAKEIRADNWETLKKFRDAGLGLGNHTFSHANLNKLKAKEYIHEIEQADKILLPVMTKPKFFRYPYLAMSSGTKRDRVLCYLAEKNYQVAPITVDSKDFVFNQRLLSIPEQERRAYLNELKPFYLDYIWQQTVKAEEHTRYHNSSEQSQILLIHANLLNAYVLPDIVSLYKERGYTFVSLEEALNTFKKTAQCSKPGIIAQRKPKKVHFAKANAPNNKADFDIESYFDWD
jgi:peptidoglycan/xylan/chitin deacetylase (PgdA/CDA1 family)